MDWRVKPVVCDDGQLLIFSIEYTKVDVIFVPVTHISHFLTMQSTTKSCPTFHCRYETKEFSGKKNKSKTFFDVNIMDNHFIYNQSNDELKCRSLINLKCSPS